ncbi:MAG: transposase, partial [Nitrososphaerota archaeon]|nr:transposase [Nitrososphaerota archaeon]
MAKPFIHIDHKNGKQYASIYTPRRNNGKKVNDPQYLGRVINKEKGIYHNKTKGTFTYTIENGYTPYTPDPNNPQTQNNQKEEKLILDFGDAYTLYTALTKTGIHKLLHELIPQQKDTLLSIIGYKLLSTTNANKYANDWYNGSYTNILYPKANLTSQRISDFYQQIGDEKIQRQFFKNYLQHFYPNQQNIGVLIDSTGLPNDIHFPLTALSTHNGVTSNESRLLLVVDQKTGIPLFFRYNAGNIVDVSTLRATIAELRAYQVHISHALIDAGYYSEANIRLLYGEEDEAGCGVISFITRLGTNLKLYKTLLLEHGQDVVQAKYMVMYRERLVYVKRVEVDLFGHGGFAYIVLDHARREEEVYKYAKSVLGLGEVDYGEMDVDLKFKGFCVLISSERVDVKEILSLYYLRQMVEQVFDVSKNYADVLPLRVHSEDAFRGHLLLSFICSVVFLLLNRLLEGSVFCAGGVFVVLRNQKCKVFDDCILVKEPTRKVNEIYKKLGIDSPLRL